MKTIKQQIAELIEYAKGENPDANAVLQRANAISRDWHEQQRQRELNRGTVPADRFYHVGIATVTSA